ncbi:MAG: tyrosine-protein phosphatase [Thermoguttaceae bacterium]
MSRSPAFVDIHCHLLAGLDDGPADWQEAVAMAQVAAADGTAIVVATPHQLGSYAANTPGLIRKQTARLQRLLDRRGIPLRVLPGADVRVEPDLAARVREGRVLTLADQGRHLLLELPHEVYFPLEGLVEELKAAGLVAILSHPERNAAILRRPAVLCPLVEAGCLIQLTAGSLTGSFGPDVQRLAESLLRQKLVHLVAADGHGARTRPPVMRAAFQRVVRLAGLPTAMALFCDNPARIVAGRQLGTTCRRGRKAQWPAWFAWRKAG